LPVAFLWTVGGRRRGPARPWAPWCRTGVTTSARGPPRDRPRAVAGAAINAWSGGDDLDGEGEGHVGVQLGEHLVGAHVLDVLVELELAPVDPRAGLVLHRV